MQALLAEWAPLLKVLFAGGGLIAALKMRVFNLTMIAGGVFAMAYFGLPEFQAFVNEHPGVVITIAGTIPLVIMGIQNGWMGVALSLCALFVAMSIVRNDLLLDVTHAGYEPSYSYPNYSAQQ